MKIKKVTLRRVFNLGNYEAFHVELEAHIDEIDNVQHVLKCLEHQALQYRLNRNKEDNTAG